MHVGAAGTDSSSDGTSGQEAKLIAAYDKLEQGMDWTDVEALVGFPANNTRGSTIFDLGGWIGAIECRLSFD
ncbi:MAG: hypothetical protein R3E42_07910 [Burkholderiaceae bacterium]